MTDKVLQSKEQRLYPTVAEDRIFRELKKKFGLKDSTTGMPMAQRGIGMQEDAKQG